jgi:hypothetical protein
MERSRDEARMSTQLPAVPKYCGTSVTPEQYAAEAAAQREGSTLPTVNDEVAMKACAALQMPIPLRLAVMFKHKLDNLWGPGVPYRYKPATPNPFAARDAAAKREHAAKVAAQKNVFPSEPRTYEEAVARWPLGPVQQEFREWCDRNQTKLRT